MVEDVKLLSARRSYEFGPDQIRLSLLSTSPAIQVVQQLFGFQSAQVGTPMITFGEVPATFPPGIVFNLGVMPSPDNRLTAIRFIHFEQRRIVVDVAGPSSMIDPVYERLRAGLDGIRGADGSPAFGEHLRTLDYSEISARCSFTPAALLDSAVRDLLTEFLVLENQPESPVIVPGLYASVWPARVESPGPDLGGYGSFQFSLRAGATPNSRIYFSAAPITTDAHLAYLDRLDAGLVNKSP